MNQENHEEGEVNLIEMWTHFDFKRLIAGAIAGLFAGTVMAVVAGLFAKMGGHEFFYPLKVAAIPVMGHDATTYGNTAAIFCGSLVHGFLCLVLGTLYSHFAKTNRLLPLLGAGFMWGTFSWVFIQNLFIRSFVEITTENLSSGAAFIILVIFGLSLSSVRIFDRLISGRS